MLQPRFFPWTQLQPWLPGNPGELSRRRTSLTGETPSATCWTRAGRSPYTWGQGRAFGSPVFSTSCETVPHCFQSQSSLVFKSSPEPYPAPSAPRFSSCRNPRHPCPIVSGPRGKDSRGVGPQSSAPAQCPQVLQTHHLRSLPRVAMATRASRRGLGRATRGSFLVGVTQPSV